ncbi:MAG: fused MFS/spermidine synthase [Kouleothrix sp.]|nr:fused MFS/spermidine synthase [Kouleothrix sp.]
MHDQDWQQAHLAAVALRLGWLRDAPDGLVHEEVSPLHHICVFKHAGQLQFYFLDPGSGELDGPMSRIDLDRPLRLLAEYTQAAMLALLWKPAPERICLLGLAGGRLSLLFYHHFPRATIDNVDVDPAVVAIAANYFGVTFDRRQTVTIQDARRYLVARGDARPYDVIVMDAFRDDTDNLDHLATTQFYQECKLRLAPGGVLCANVLRSDRLFYEKAKTFLHSFRHVSVSEQKHGLVLLGNDQRGMAAAEAARRAGLLQRRHVFEFPLVERAAGLRRARAIESLSAPALRDVRLLDDR